MCTNKVHHILYSNLVLFKISVILFDDFRESLVELLHLDLREIIVFKAFYSVNVKLLCSIG